MEIKINSLESIHEAAKQFIAAMEDNTVFAFYGKMGAGKTTFIKAICEELGVTDVINSPTFAIVNEYHGDIPVYHFDMYRVMDEDDLYSTGFYDYLGKGLIIIEWSENVLDYLPEDAIFIELSYAEDINSRIIRRK